MFMNGLKFVIMVMVLVVVSTCQAREPGEFGFDSDESLFYGPVRPGTIELGADASVSYIESDIFTVMLPDNIRLGVFISRSTSVVWRLATSVAISGSRHESANSFAFGFSHYEFSASRRSSAVFEMMGLADIWTNGITDSQYGFGVGIGFQGIYQSICPRIEVVFERWMKSGFASRFVIKALFGFSFYGLN